MNFSMNLKSTSCPMMITVEELLNEMKQDKATEKRCGYLNFRIHEILTTWKILRQIRTTNQAQEEDLHPGEWKGKGKSTP
jgi:hypothetical protein